jgi:hypothetical protein
MKQVRFANVVAYVFEFEMFQPFFPRFFQTTILSNNNSRDERAENESRQKQALPSLHKSCRRRSEGRESHGNSRRLRRRHLQPRQRRPHHRQRPRPRQRRCRQQQHRHRRHRRRWKHQHRRPMLTPIWLHKHCSCARTTRSAQIIRPKLSPKYDESTQKEKGRDATKNSSGSKNVNNNWSSNHINANKTTTTTTNLHANLHANKHKTFVHVQQSDNYERNDTEWRVTARACRAT